MFNDSKGAIEHFSWGKFVINGEEHGKTNEGKKGKGKDICLIGIIKFLKKPWEINPNPWNVCDIK